MSDALKNFIVGMGAMAEAMCVFRDNLLKNGFTRQEALKLTEVFLAQTLSNSNNTKEDN